MFCPNCRAKLNDSAKFCLKCGTEIKYPSSTAAGPQIQVEGNTPHSVPRGKKKRKYLIPNLISLLVFAGIVFSVYQLFFKNEQADFPENAHEFTEEQRASLNIYDLGEIKATSSGKLDGKWVIITGVHSFAGADPDTRMLPAFPRGSNLFTEIYYYSPQDFSLACLALAFDETTVLGKCRYEDGNYSITDAILLTNDTLEPIISVDGNSASAEQEINGSTSERVDNEYDVSITGDQLLEEARQNIARTISNYEGKRVKITGLEIIYVDTKSAWFDTVQSIYFRNSKDLQAINTGSRITVIGSIAEEFGTYCITDAVLVADGAVADHAEGNNAATDNGSGTFSDLSAVEDIYETVPPGQTTAYIAGEYSANDLFKNIPAGLDSSNLKIGILYNDAGSIDVITGFCDTAEKLGIKINAIEYYISSNSTDFTVQLYSFQMADVNTIFFVEPNTNQSPEVGTLVLAQANALGFYPFMYDFNWGYIDAQQEDTSDGTLNDFGTIEGTYHMAHNYTLQMGLWFETDMTGINSSNWQASEPLELHFQLNTSNEILGDGVAYWWPLSEGLPLFEGELYSSHDPITIEYDGYDFIVTCSALDLYEASFFKD